MAGRAPRGRKTKSRPRAKPRSRTAAPVREAASIAVARVLGSEEAFRLLIRKLEAAGWRIERLPAARAVVADVVPERAR